MATNGRMKEKVREGKPWEYLNHFPKDINSNSNLNILETIHRDHVNLKKKWEDSGKCSGSKLLHGD